MNGVPPTFSSRVSGSLPACPRFGCSRSNSTNATIRVAILCAASGRSRAMKSRIALSRATARHDQINSNGKAFRRGFCHRRRLVAAAHDRCPRKAARPASLPAIRNAPLPPLLPHAGSRPASAPDPRCSSPAPPPSESSSCVRRPSQAGRAVSSDPALVARSGWCFLCLP